MKNIKVSFEDMVSIYEELGYDVILKRGSHAVVPISDTINIPLVIPHSAKCMHPKDLKRLKYVVSGEFEKAKLV